MMRQARSAIGGMGVVLVLVAPAAAQDARHPDFSGTWVVDGTSGDLPQRAVEALTKGARQPMTLVIEQTSSELSVRRESDGTPVTMVFPLDGRETTQETPHGSMTSRTEWRGASLVTSGKRPLPGPFPFGTRTVAFSETRTLSSDGARLTIDVRFHTPRGVKTRTATLRRLN